METVRVAVMVRNPAQPDRTWKGLFRVDTGAMSSFVPGRCLRGIGLQPQGERSCQLADGSEGKVEVVGVQVELMGEMTCTTVIFGSDDAEPILGLTALESMGIELDPQDQRLRRLPAVRLK